MKHSPARETTTTAQYIYDMVLCVCYALNMLSYMSESYSSHRRKTICTKTVGVIQAEWSLARRRVCLAFVIFAYLQ